MAKGSWWSRTVVMLLRGYTNANREGLGLTATMGLAYINPGFWERSLCMMPPRDTERWFFACGPKETATDGVFTRWLVEDNHCQIVRTAPLSVWGWSGKTAKCWIWLGSSHPEGRLHWVGTLLGVTADRPLHIQQLSFGLQHNPVPLPNPYP
eukprot:TRINITY_DN46723_c0_g1_i1.p1 TRINITY_DN46723_c0_g1~~TRINITY_DN46723_c0_g1_i1.p1  ORF type:complete len:152 (+),score=9.77 TRINITY_DN46723_c0_g1_i1:333-788(+)